MYKIKINFLFLVLKNKTKFVKLINSVKFNLFSIFFLFFTQFLFAQEKAFFFTIPVVQNKNFYSIPFGSNINLSPLDTVFSVDKKQKFIIQEVLYDRAKFRSDLGNKQDLKYIKLSLPLASSQINIFVQLAQKGIWIKLNKDIINSPDKIIKYNRDTKLSLLSIIKDSLKIYSSYLKSNIELKKGYFKNNSLKYALSKITNRHLELFFNYIEQSNLKNDTLNFYTGFISWIKKGLPYGKSDLLKNCSKIESEAYFNQWLDKNHFQINPEFIEYSLSESKKIQDSLANKAYKYALISEKAAHKLGLDSLEIMAKLQKSKVMRQKNNFYAAYTFCLNAMQKADSIHNYILWKKAFLYYAELGTWDANNTNFNLFLKNKLSLLSQQKSNLSPKDYLQILQMIYEFSGDYFYFRKNKINAKKYYKMSMEIDKENVNNSSRILILNKKLNLCN